MTCCWIPAITWSLIDEAVSVRLQTNHWSDWAQIWWAILTWASLAWFRFWSCSTEFQSFPGLWLIKQYKYICRQTTDRIYLKLVSQLIVGLPWLDQLLIMLRWIPALILPTLIWSWGICIHWFPVVGFNHDLPWYMARGTPGTTKPDGEARGFCGDRRPEGHVFHTSRQAMIKTYYSTSIRIKYGTKL